MLAGPCTLWGMATAFTLVKAFATDENKADATLTQLLDQQGEPLPQLWQGLATSPFNFQVLMQLCCTVALKMLRHPMFI